MSSDSSIKDQLLSMVNRFPFRQTVSTPPPEVDGTPSSVKRSSAFGTISRSSTLNLLTRSGATQSQGDHGPGYTSSSGNPPAPAQPHNINVVLFGETGVGKSSVINLIARKEVAKVSSDVNGCTMQSTRYDISFDDLDFTIFDTIGLEEPQMGVNGYLKAIEKAYELIMKLGAAGGIHLLLFCMRGGRITATTQSNYRLFCECLCSTKVPIALVFTGLEREVEMEDWWRRNKNHIEHYGIKSNGHACITAVQDDTPGEDLKYTESQRRIRELLKDCALKNDAFLPEQHTWFARLGRGMRSFIEKHKNPKRKDVVRVLTRRCKLDPETAKKIADMMEKGDTETKTSNQDGQAENRPAEGPPDPAAGNDENDGTKNITEAELPSAGASEGMDHTGFANENVVPSRSEIETEPRTVRPEEKNKGVVTEEKAIRHRTVALLQSDVDTQRRAVGLEGKDKSGDVVNEKPKHHGTVAPQNDAEAEPRTTRPERKDKSSAVDENAAKHPALPPPQSDVQMHPRTAGLEGKERSGSASEKTKHRSLTHPYSDGEAGPRTAGQESKGKDGVAKEKAVKNLILASPPKDVEIESRDRPVRLEGMGGKQPKVSGNGGGQSLDTGLVEQANLKPLPPRSDARPQPRLNTSTVRPSASSRQAIYIRSQS